MRTTFMISLFFYTTVAHTQPGILLDLAEYWQFIIESQNGQGAKIRLQNAGGTPFLGMGSSHEQFDIFHPFISRPKDLPLVFITEDPEGQIIKEQMRITQHGDLQIENLKGSSTRILTTTSEGTLKPLVHFGQYSGLITLNAHNFVSHDNPGDDHNFNESISAIHHENQLIGNEILVAPLHLPQGAIIKQINVYYIDNNGGSNQDIEVKLMTRPILHPSGMDSFSSIGTTSGASAAVQVLSNTMLDVVVDNLLNMYYIRAAKPTDETDWPGDNVGLAGATIFYE